MKYRQWKKNYKKKYGANPPFELDKRKQRRYARKMARQINITLPTMMETLTKEIDGWMKSLKSALITMCESMAITLNDTAGHLREEREEKIKCFKILMRYGWSYEREEADLVYGNHELYKKES